MLKSLKSCNLSLGTNLTILVYTSSLLLLAAKSSLVEFLAKEKHPFVGWMGFQVSRKNLFFLLGLVDVAFFTFFVD
jgi:hypothetical protein